MISPAAIIGAGLGLAIGLLDYRIVSRVLEGRQREANRALDHAARVAATKRMVLARRALFVVCVVGFPLAGFWAGASLG